jgi:ribosome biogenesis GTPase
MTEGTIVRGVGGFYYVDTADGQVECRARGKMRREKIMPMVGDRVRITIAGENLRHLPTGAVDEILPRKNALARPPVANIDCVVIVAATAMPAPDFFVIDKLIASAENVGIDVILVMNKTDLTPSDEIARIYAPTGYRMIPACAPSGDGVARLKEILRGKTAAFAGNSGVGKSSILNDFGFSLPIGAVSKIERGKHTNRHVELMRWEPDSFVMDTPGFSLLEPQGIAADVLRTLFMEFAPYAGGCRFKNCMHVHADPKDCAVTAAVESGAIAASRYASYCALYDQLKDVRAWDK